MSFQFAAYQIAELAADVEEASTHFYKQLALATKDPAVRETFNLLSAQEQGHRAAFAAMARSLQQKDEVHEYSIDLYEDLQHVLNKLKTSAFPSTVTDHPREILSALDVAVKAEETSVNVYTQLRNALSGEFRDALDGILKVESHHCQWVTDLRNKVRAIV